MVMKYADNIVKVKTHTFNLVAHFTGKKKQLGSSPECCLKHESVIKFYPVYY